MHEQSLQNPQLLKLASFQHLPSYLLQPPAPLRPAKTTSPEQRPHSACLAGPSSSVGSFLRDEQRGQ